MNFYQSVIAASKVTNEYGNYLIILYYGSLRCAHNDVITAGPEFQILLLRQVLKDSQRLRNYTIKHLR